MKLTTAQARLLNKAAADKDGAVYPFHGEWNAAYSLSRTGLLAIRIPPGKNQHYVITEEGRKALSETP